MTHLAWISALAFTAACTASAANTGYGPASGAGAAWTIGVEDTADTVYRLDGAGAHDEMTFVGEALVSITAISADDVWVIGNALHHYDGHAWTTMAMPKDPVFAIGAGWAVGVHGTIYDPASFTALSGPSSLIDLELQSFDWPAAWGDAPNDIWATDGGRLFHFTTQWTDVTPWTDELPEQITGTNAHDVWVSGFTGQMYHFDGASWITVPSGVSEVTFGAMFATASNDVWAVGTAALTHYDGSNWTSTMPLPVGCASTGGTVCGFIVLDGVWASSANDVWVTGYDQQDPGQSPVLLHYDGQWHDLSNARP